MRVQLNTAQCHAVDRIPLESIFNFVVMNHSVIIVNFLIKFSRFVNHKPRGLIYYIRSFVSSPQQRIYVTNSRFYCICIFAQLDYGIVEMNFKGMLFLAWNAHNASAYALSYVFCAIPTWNTYFLIEINCSTISQIPRLYVLEAVFCIPRGMELEMLIQQERQRCLKLAFPDNVLL